MRSLDSSNTSDSAPSDDEDDGEKLPSFKAANIPTPRPQPLKRSHSMRTSDTPPSSPTTKRVRPSTASSIRRALEKKDGPQGILLFFRKATDEEHREWLKRTCAGDAEELENMEWEKKKEDQILQVKKRRNATKCKQKQRAKEKKREVLAGLRSPGGSKIKVSHLTFTSREVLTTYLKVTEVHLQHTTSINMGGSVPELSRPARSLKAKFKAKVRKASGRKSKNTEKRTKYHNWFSPFLFKQIELARINSGGPKWSTRAITRELQKRDFETFKGLKRTTMDGWIDHSGVKPCWSEKTLQHVQKGNEPGHTNGGRKGALVSNC
jgi:hypothetical protein